MLEREGLSPRRLEPTSRGLGGVIATGGGVAVVCLAVDGQSSIVAVPDLLDELWVGFTLYSLDQILLAIGIVVSGLLLLSGRTRSLDVGLIAVAGVWAAELSALGLVALRRWRAFAGSYGTVADWDLVRFLAAVLAAACGVTAVLCLMTVMRSRVSQRGALVVALPIGVAISATLPFLLPWGGADALDRIAALLMYGLPLGIGIAVTGIMSMRNAVVVTAGTVVSALLMSLASTAFVSPDHQLTAIIFVSAAALANLVWRAVIRRRDRVAFVGETTT